MAATKCFARGDVESWWDGFARGGDHETAIDAFSGTKNFAFGPGDVGIFGIHRFLKKLVDGVSSSIDNALTDLFDPVRQLSK